MSRVFNVGVPKAFNKALMLKRIDEILSGSSWGNNGYYVQAVEDYIKEYVGCNDAVLVSNATDGLELSIRAHLKTFDFLKDFDLDELTCLMPSFTFVAAASVCKRLGIGVTYGDITKDFCLDPKSLEGIPEWDFIIPASLFGNQLDNSFYGENTYPTIVDNAHSLGCFNEPLSCYVGNDCEAGVFSLHSTKLGGSGEAGIITCKSTETADYIREMRSFGYGKSDDREGRVDSVGGNFKVTEVQAALALTQLENIQEIQEHYFNVHQEYERLLPNLIKQKNNMFSNWSYVVVQVDARKRDSIISRMNQDGIFPRTYFKPLHHMSVYKENINLPMTDKISSEIMCLPTGLTISLEDVQYISRSLANAIKEG